MIRYVINPTKRITLQKSLEGKFKLENKLYTRETQKMDWKISSNIYSFFGKIRQILHLEGRGGGGTLKIVS